MGGRPQKREKASGHKGVGTGFHVEREMDSRWDWVLVLRLACVTGFTLERVYVGRGLRFYVGTRFRLVGERFNVGTLEWVYVGTGLR